jgi:GTP-binding protein HflX
VQIAPNKSILLSDTVGFIRKLPHKLIESFKSTLDEVRESDTLLHVVDATHPRFEDQITVVNQTLRELEALDKPTLMVFNKVDALEERGLLGALREEYPNVAFISALRGIGLGELQQKVIALIEQDFVERVAYVPSAASREIAHIHRVADVLSQEFLSAPASNGSDAPVSVTRLHFRIAPRYDRDLRPLLEKFDRFKPASRNQS